LAELQTDRTLANNKLLLAYRQTKHWQTTDCYKKPMSGALQIGLLLYHYYYWNVVSAQ